MDDIDPYMNLYPQPYSQGANFGAYQPRLERREIIHVNGQPGAAAFRMAPNSNALLLDDTAPIVWLCVSDGAGYHTVTPYTITPYEAPAPVDLNSIEARLKKLEEKINESHVADA